MSTQNKTTAQVKPTAINTQATNEGMRPQLEQAKEVIVAAPWLAEVSAIFGLTVDQVDDLIQQTILNFAELTRLVYVGAAGDKEGASRDIKAIYGDMLPKITMAEVKTNFITNAMLILPKLRDWTINTFGQEAGQAFDEAFKEMSTKAISMKANNAKVSDYAKEFGNFLLDHISATTNTPAPQASKPLPSTPRQCVTKPVAKPTPKTEQLILSVADLEADDVTIGTCFRTAS